MLKPSQLAFVQGKKSTIVPDCRCTSCRAPINVHTDPDPTGDAVAQPGDIAICLHCGHVMMIAGDGTVREAEPDELREIFADPEVRATIKRLQRARRNIGLAGAH